MANHPNRSTRAKGVPSYTPEAVLKARTQAGHTQTQAAATVYRTLRGWQEWEAGTRTVDPAVFELYLIRTGALL